MAYALCMYACVYIYIYIVMSSHGCLHDSTARLRVADRIREFEKPEPTPITALGSQASQPFRVPRILMSLLLSKDGSTTWARI